MSDKLIAAPPMVSAAGQPEAALPPPSPSVGQNIEQSINKLGQAAQDAAREWGAAAGKAADQAAAKLSPMADSAAKSLDATTRDLGVAASTVKQGCAEITQSVWDAVAVGNFGQAGEIIKAASATCSDSFGASLMALFPWLN